MIDLVSEVKVGKVAICIERVYLGTPLEAKINPNANMREIDHVR